MPETLFELHEADVRRIDLERMDGALRFAEENAGRYRANQPFPHVVIDDFLPEKLLDDVIANFASVRHDNEKDFYGSRQKFATSDVRKFDPTAYLLFCDLNSAPFLAFIEKLTGIDGLISDPYLFGGGFHEIRRGGFLKMHADFNWHEKLRLDRRLNLLIYLNRDWQEDWGGALEIARPDLKRTTRILPLFNRAVLFSTSDDSFHGHPDPLACPESESRKSLALYYYSNGRPDGEVRRRGRTGTDYRARPNEALGRPSLPVRLGGLAGRAFRNGVRRLRGG